MPKYAVEMTHILSSTQRVEVEAESVEEANTLAYEQANWSGTEHDETRYHTWPIQQKEA